MYRWLVGAIVIALAAAAAWYLWHVQPSAPTPNESAPNNQATSTPQLSNDLYPLYSKAQWSAPAVERVTVGTTTYAGASVASASLGAGMDPGSIFTPFENYYDKKLKALGYKVANDLAAGGHVGGQTGYRKGSAVVLTRFSINYHTTPANAPSQCPCDVTLSLFSANQ